MGKRTTMKNVTVGMTSYNLLDYSKTTLESIDRYVDDYNFHLVVIDDCSTSEPCDEYFSNFKPKNKRVLSWNYERLPKNMGAPTSWNKVLDWGSKNNSDITLVLNNDIIPGKNWLSNLINFMEKDDEIGVGSSHVLNETIYGEAPNNVTKSYNMGKWFEYTENFCKQNSNKVDEGLHGCCIALTKECIDIVGKFDTIYERTSYEDCDYVVRAQRLGFKVLIPYTSLLYHYGGITQRYMDEYEGGNSYQTRNRWRFEQKFGINLSGYTYCRAMFWDKKPDGTNEKVII